MKKIKLMLTMILSLALFGGMGSVKANTQATIANGATNSTITIQRSVTGASSPVTNTFTYTVTADSGNPATATGVPTGTHTIVMSAQALSGTTATKTTSISFAGAKFPKPGDYVYTITETNTSDANTYPRDTSNSYTVKVSVRNHTATDFSTAMDATILLFNGTGTSATKKSDNSTVTFTKAAAYKTITLAKTVEGTMAETDAEFPFTITIKGGLAGDKYTISGGVSPTGCTVASSATSCNLTVSLKHGQTATISGVRLGQTYTFSETGNTTTNKYQTFINGSTTNSKSLASDLTVAATNANTVKNVYNQAVLTGIVTRYLPYVLVVAIAIAGIVFVVIRNSKKAKEEDIEL